MKEIEKVDRRKQKSKERISHRYRCKPGLRGLELLHRLIDYELRGAARYRRFATLTMMSIGHHQADLKELLRDTVRNCDEFVELESGAAVLMSETDTEDALIAVERYKCRCADQVDLRFAVASYPADGRGTVELLEILQRRLNQAEASGNGAVVAKG